MPAESPYDLDAEAAVLGSVLLNRDALIAIAPIVKPEDFYLGKHQDIYTAMLACYAERTPPDIRVLAAWLDRRKKLDSVGGLPYLSELIDVPTTSYHAEHYARIVAEEATRRRLISIGSQIAKLGFDRATPIDQQLASAAALLLTAQHHERARFATMQQVADDLYAVMDGGVQRGVSTGLRSLDAIIGRLIPGDLMIIAGRPGHGKSVLALLIGEHVARTADRPVAMYSFEMARTELAQRLIATRTGVSTGEQRAQTYSEADSAAIYRALGEIASLPLLICDERGLDITGVRTEALRQASLTDGLSLIIVDYLTLIETTIERGSTYAAAVGNISRGLKRLAREVNCPVIALSQLNREIEKRAGYEPELSDLRDSGSVEQDADQVVFVVRPEKLIDPEKEPQEYAKVAGKAYLFVKKNRHDNTGIAVVRFDGPYMTMQDLTYRTIAGYDDRPSEDADDADNR